MPRLTEEREKELREGLICLVPRPESDSVITSHENTLCDCQVLEILDELDALRAELKTCVTSHQKQNILCEKLEGENEKLKGQCYNKDAEVIRYKFKEEVANDLIALITEQLKVAVEALESLHFYCCTACDENKVVRDEALAKINGTGIEKKDSCI